MSLCPKSDESLRPGTEICTGCGNEIDPDVCHCGDGPDSPEHYTSGGNHGFVPAGCDCGRAPEEDFDQAQEWRRRERKSDVHSTERSNPSITVLVKDGRVMATRRAYMQVRRVVRVEYDLPPEPRALGADWSFGGPLFERSEDPSVPSLNDLAGDL